MVSSQCNLCWDQAPKKFDDSTNKKKAVVFPHSVEVFSLRFFFIISLLSSSSCSMHLPPSMCMFHRCEMNFYFTHWLLFVQLIRFVIIIFVADISTSSSSLWIAQNEPAGCLFATKNSICQWQISNRIQNHHLIHSISIPILLLNSSVWFNHIQWNRLHDKITFRVSIIIDVVVASATFQILLFNYFFCLSHLIRYYARNLYFYVRKLNKKFDMLIDWNGVMMLNSLDRCVREPLACSLVPISAEPLSLGWSMCWSHWPYSAVIYFRAPVEPLRIPSNRSTSA